MKNVYCAGPFVFQPPENREQVQKWLFQKLRQQHLNPIFPWDEGGQDVNKIREINLLRIEEADGLLADLRPFRGAEPDAGTVYECAWASCTGVPHTAYAGQQTYKEIVEQRWPADADTKVIYRTEDFGLHCNLMLGKNVYSTPLEAIQALAIEIHKQIQHAA